MANIAKRPDGRWRARYRDEANKEHARHFTRKIDARRWLDGVTAAQDRGDYVDPHHSRPVVRDLADRLSHSSPEDGSSAEVHLKLIVKAFGPMQLSSVKPSHVKAWTAQLRSEGRADSYVYPLHARLSQLMNDAVHDGMIARNPCSCRTSPGTGGQRPSVATTEQIWALYDAMPAGLCPAILFGAFVGLRPAPMLASRLASSPSATRGR